MLHGSRCCYRHGCRCLRCRSAEAGYRSRLRKGKAKGLPLAGKLVKAGATWRRVKQLATEGFTHAEIAKRLGLKTARLRWHHERVRVSTAARIEALYRREMGSECQNIDSDSLKSNHA